MSDEAVKIEAAQPEVAAPAESSTIEATSAKKEDVTMTEPEEDNVKTEATEQKVEATQENGDIKAEADETKDVKPAETKPLKTTTNPPNMLKTTGTINENWKSNRKFDPSVNGITDDPSKIRAQVEFYFGDSNLPTDKFLFGLVGGQENKPVKLKQICSFKRMHRFQPYEAVVKAIEDSHFLNITGEKGDEEISRKRAYEPTKNSGQRKVDCSVYVKGFGDEQPSTQFDCEAFFTKFGSVNAVRLRRTPELFFKGSVFVEFATPEEAKAFLALDPPPKWQGHDLKIMSKKEYTDEKDQLIREGKLEPSESKPGFNGARGSDHRGRGRGRGRGGGGGYKGRDPDNWKERADKDRKGGFKHNDRRGGRGGRGNRGSRGGRLDDRDNNRRDNKDGSKDNKDGSKDEVKSDAPKRARDDDGGAEERPAKKVDAKADVAAEA